MMKSPTKIDALLSLAPGAEVIVRGDNVEWIGSDSSKPSDSEIAEELDRLTAEYQRNEYQRKRAAEYPPITDYLDGIVKGDTKQVQAYKDACIAVKAKYPKP